MGVEGVGGRAGGVVVWRSGRHGRVDRWLGGHGWAMGAAGMKPDDATEERFGVVWGKGHPPFPSAPLALCARCRFARRGLLPCAMRCRAGAATPCHAPRHNVCRGVGRSLRGPV